MYSKEEIYIRMEGQLSLEEAVQVLRSYIYLRKGETISVIPPRDPREMFMFQKYLTHIKNWAA
jgi:hypothetical protein